MLNYFWIILSFFFIGCVSEVNNPADPVIELEGASTEEIEDGSFATAEIDFNNGNGFRNELTFLALGNEATQGQGYYVTIKIDPKGRTITSPELVLPDNFEFVGSSSGNFASLYGTCSNTISAPCDVIVLFTPKNNFQTTEEILFHYTHVGKGYRTRLPVNIKAVGKLNVFAGVYGPISNGVGNNMCAIGKGGEVKCWGSSLHSNLGIDNKYANWGDSPDELGDRIPIYTLDKNVLRMRLGGEFGCIQYTDNTLKCFGNNNDGALAQNNSQSISLQSLNSIKPIKFPKDITLIDFSVGLGHVCGLFNHNPSGQKEVRCWGRNDLGQSGIGNIDSTYTSIGYGYYSHLTEKFQDFTEGLFKVPLQVSEPIEEVVSNKNSNCIRFTSGAVKCWGDNLYGQLGLGDRTTRGNNGTTGTLYNESLIGNENLLIDLGTSITAEKIYGGPGEHFCAKTSSTTAKCWGRNDQGQLGQDDTNHRGDDANEMGDNLDDILIPTDHTIEHMSLGVAHTCVHLEETATKTQKIFCFGDGDSIGSRQANNIGDDVGEMAGLSGVAFGSDFEVQKIHSEGAHTCAQSTNNKIKCFGKNSYGQLGTGDTETIGDGLLEMGENLEYLTLPSYTNITDIAIGLNNTCAVLDKRKLVCLGDNTRGYINSSRGVDLGTTPGNSGAALAALPLGNEKATQVSVGYDHACAVFENFKAKCWGKNTYGQLGLESTRDYVDLTAQGQDELEYIDLGNNIFVESIHAGKHFTCAVVSGVYTYNSSSPTPPPNRVKCWGRNQYGQTGAGTTSNIGDQPGEMGDDLDFVDFGNDGSGNDFTVVDFDSGMNHSCAIVNSDPTLNFLSPRRIKCWGKNDSGQLGQESSLQVGHTSNQMGNNLAFSNIGPVIAPYTDFEEIKLGDDFSCARRSTELYCWGKNHKGQLGVGSTNNIGDNGNEMDDDLDRVILSIPDANNFDFTFGVPIANGKSQWTVGNQHVCVMTASDSKNIHCWGDGRYLGAGYGINIGDLNNSVATNFVQTRSEASLLGISAQGESTCIYYVDGMAKCWGNGKYLGNGRRHDQGNYYRVLGAPNFPFLWF